MKHFKFFFSFLMKMLAIVSLLLLSVTMIPLSAALLKWDMSYYHALLDYPPLIFAGLIISIFMIMFFIKSYESKN